MLKAFMMDDYGTLYAAENAEQAARLYVEDAGEAIELEEVRELTDAELDAEQPETDENEQPTGGLTSVRQWLKEMSEAGFLAGRDG